LNEVFTIRDAHNVTAGDSVQYIWYLRSYITTTIDASGVASFAIPSKPVLIGLRYLVVFITSSLVSFLLG